MILFVGLQTLSAQTKAISGKVVDDLGDIIPGVSIIVKGTTTGTITGSDGTYQFNVPDGTIALVYSFVGMETQEIAYTGQSIIDVTLNSDMENIGEVVVVAYGTSKREALTGSVAQVSAKEIENRSVSSVTAALEGMGAGLQVNNTYGEPGSSPSIRIRGFSSINGSNVPLYIVDGAEYEGSIASLNPQDIESMSVLKDASSAALYGSRASNGVILITTKQGKDDKVTVTANVNLGVYVRGLKDFERMGADEWMETEWTGYKNYAMSNPDLSYDESAAASYSSDNVIGDIIQRNIYNKADSELYDSDGKLVDDAEILSGYDDLDWADEVERAGKRQEYNISASAAKEKYNFYTSLGYLNEEGYMITSDLERFTGRAKINFNPKDWFKGGVNFSLTTSDSNKASDADGSSYINPFYMVRNMAPVYPIYLHNEDGSYNLDNEGNKQYDLESSYLSSRHIIYELKNNLYQNDRLNISGTAYATFILPKNFELKINGSKRTVSSNYKQYDNPYVGDGAGSEGRLYYTYNKYNTVTLSQQLTWEKQFDNHHIDILLAHENYSWEYSYQKTGITGIGIDGIIENNNFSSLTSISGYSYDSKLESYLTRARYSFKDKYFFDASFRRDGSSRFYEDNRWGNFFSVGGSWMASRENFLSDLAWLDDLKVRASYGQVGNDSGFGYYPYMSLYTLDTNGGESAYYRSNLPNYDLQWETLNSYDVAIEGRVFNRLNFTIDYFNKVSDKLIMDVTLASSNGTTDTSSTGAEITKNAGKVTNHGLELSFDVDIVKNKDFKWNFGANTTLLKNEILKLYDGEDIINGNYTLSEGKSVYEFKTYHYEGVDQMTGDALYEIDAESYYVAESGEDAADRTAIDSDYYREVNGEYYTINTTYGVKKWSGSAIPDAYGSFSNSFSYKNFNLSVLMTYGIGGKLYDSSYRSLMQVSTSSAKAIHKDVSKSWSSAPDGMTETSANRIDPNGIPRVDMYYSSYFNSMSDRWLMDASYLVFKNINLSYSLPQIYLSKLDLSKVTLKAGVENLATFTSKQGLNPQYSYSGSSDDTFVTARVFSFGLDVTF
jgi:TonB-linked SusC/RagA family outer membrane protein